jgi:hypothetical protein
MAKGALAQAGLGLHRQAVGPGDFLGGLPGARQIAGVDHADAFIGQRLACALRLPEARGIETDVELALDAGVDVPGGFAVANGDQSGGFFHAGILEVAYFVAVARSMFTRRSPCGGFGKPCSAAWNITDRIAALAL